LKNTPFEVTFIYGSNPMEPVALARTKIEKDPFRYKTYPDTPPTTPKMSTMKSTDKIEIIDCEKSSNSTEEVSAKENAHFGKIITKRERENNLPVKGRLLWLFNEGIKDHLRESDTQFRKHVQKSINFVTVSYVRKSLTTELHETKIRLLNLMITRLKKRCFCKKIFASFSSLSSSPIIQRDYNTNNIELKLIDCAGNTQDILSFFHTNIKFIRLCVIDSAGLSNDLDDVYNTLKLYKSVKEIVEDHGYRIEVIDRHSLLYDKKNISIQKFKNRTGCKRRAQT
ncbi:hypothetical protein CU098_000325, partial [Rhizopus stolonifer]